MRPTLFLNLDGTCHPKSIQYAVLRGYPHVGPPHFCWAEPLRPVLEDWDAQVVLRSSSTMMFGLEPVAGLAPEWLHTRIVGACGDVVRYIALFEPRKVNTSYGVVRRYVQEHQLQHWVALDDDTDGWPADSELRRHLVACDGRTGLGNPLVARRINQAFSECIP
ncbi:HAD domain-containing protein [Roseateles koreensis]|uniref:HAD domain-containing protein n=1 Tax=Roseateles koreensis TaxID=2987526 RepID=A0ABT5KTQ0_9BURK|nr:HAD domain-containing protein [Roseateles koreensis]MDC8786313.1 HAD domain-containing protein [Roseateles koreensis]